MFPFIVDLMEENSMISITFDMTGEEELNVSFKCKGAIARHGICRDFNATPPPVGLAPPSETQEPAIYPIDPTPSPIGLAHPSAI